MTADLAAPPVTGPSQLDRVEAQLAALTEQVAAERADRQRWKDLTHELMPVAQDAMSLASRELEDLSADVTVEDLVRFARTAARTLPQLEGLMAQLSSANELVHEVTSLAGAGMGSLSDTLATAESRGYFAAARYGAGVVDRMVTTLDDDPHAPPPSALGLLRQLRDPQVRRGLARMLQVLRILGADPSPGTPTARTTARMTTPTAPTTAKD
jgi:uncharacterized protein YjgD (DUF1641 family)